MSRRLAGTCAFSKGHALSSDQKLSCHDIMNDQELKKAFGNDYPIAVIVKGVRMPLAAETRFTRYYHTGEPNTGGCTISRFMDGSALMTAAELRRDWAAW